MRKTAFQSLAALLIAVSFTAYTCDAASSKTSKHPTTAKKGHTTAGHKHASSKHSARTRTGGKHQTSSGVLTKYDLDDDKPTASTSQHVLDQYDLSDSDSSAPPKKTAKRSHTTKHKKSSHASKKSKHK